MSSYQAKYIKYKQKYINLKTQLGGACPKNPIWDDKTPFVSSIVIPEIIEGPYSMTPKNYESTKTYNPPTIKEAYNRITERFNKLTDFIAERTDRIAKIEAAKKQSTSCLWGSVTFVEKLDKQLIEEKKELDKKKPLLLKTQYNKSDEATNEYKKLQIAERYLIDTYLKTIIEPDINIKLQKYSEYLQTIEIKYQLNKEYLESEINKPNNELGSIITTLSSESNLEKVLSKAMQLILSVKFNKSKEYLQELPDKIKERKCILIKFHLGRLGEIISKRKPTATYSESTKLMKQNVKKHFINNNDDYVKNFQLLLANTNLKPSFIVSSLYLVDASHNENLLEENKLQSYNTTTLESMKVNAEAALKEFCTSS
jgi:hypothetical protein